MKKALVGVLCILSLVFSIAPVVLADLTLEKALVYIDNRPLNDLLGYNGGPSLHLEVTLRDLVGVPDNIKSVQALNNGITYGLAYIPNYKDYQSITDFESQYGVFDIFAENLDGDYANIQTYALTATTLLALPTTLKVDLTAGIFQFDPVAPRSQYYGYKLSVFDLSNNKVLMGDGAVGPYPYPYFSIPVKIRDLIAAAPDHVYLFRAEAINWDTNFKIQRRSVEYLLSRPVPSVECKKFEPPLAKGTVPVHNSRVLPLKAELFNNDGSILTATDFTKPPVIKVVKKSNGSDVTANALNAGTGGSEFQFEDSGTRWHYNLETKNFETGETYEILMISGNEAEYTIYPACKGSFEIE